MKGLDHVHHGKSPLPIIPSRDIFGHAITWRHNLFAFNSEKYTKKTTTLILALSASFASDSSFYLDAGIGLIKADLPSVSGTTLDDKDTGFSLGVGYNFNKNFAVEAGYQRLGTVSYSASGGVTGSYNGAPYTLNGSARLAAEDTDGWYVGPKVSLPLNEKFEINARAGWYMWKTDVVATASLGGTYNGQAIAASGSASKKYDGTDMYYGVGAVYNIDKNIAVGVDYTRFKIDTVDVDTRNVKAKYSF